MRLRMASQSMPRKPSLHDDEKPSQVFGQRSEVFRHDVCLKVMKWRGEDERTFGDHVRVWDDGG